jgi:hypothetical protein
MNKEELIKEFEREAEWRLVEGNRSAAKLNSSGIYHASAYWRAFNDWLIEKLQSQANQIEKLGECLSDLSKSVINSFGSSSIAERKALIAAESLLKETEL